VVTPGRAAFSRTGIYMLSRRKPRLVENCAASLVSWRDERQVLLVVLLVVV
jgi:hypothetical protein